MEHRLLGSSSLELPVITFGAWAIGGLFWGGTDDDAAIAAIHAAIDHGIDAIDTAPIYGCGHSEEVVGKAIRGRRDQVKVLTKCGLRWDDRSGDLYFVLENTPDGKPVTVYKNVTAPSIRRECEGSLMRLGIDCIDLYQVHWPSSTASASETMAELLVLREKGKIRHFGVSNYNTKQLAEVCSLAPVASDQVKYNLLERGIEADPLPFCRYNNIGVICYSPMSLGLLTGKVTMEREFPPSDIRRGHAWFRPDARRRVLDALEQVRPIAESHNATLAQLAVAWVVGQEGVTTALVGARNAEQAIENAAAGDLTLSADELATLRRTFEAVEPPAK